MPFWATSYSIGWLLGLWVMYSSGLVDVFEGICRAPQTEQETIILFSKLSQHFKMKIESVSTRFPDAYIRVKEDERWVTKSAEFELYSSKFADHLKQIDKGKECDMIICWEDDWKDKPKNLNLEIIELKKKS